METGRSAGCTARAVQRGTTGRQRRNGTTCLGGVREARSGGMNKGDGIWRFYTDDATGLKIGPVPVLFMALALIASTAADIGGVSLYDISVYGGDKKKLTRRERMKRRARRMIKAGLREDQCYCCSLEGVPVTACLIVAAIILFTILCVTMFSFAVAGFSITKTTTEPAD